MDDDSTAWRFLLAPENLFAKIQQSQLVIGHRLSFGPIQWTKMTDLQRGRIVVSCPLT
jgi:hypothetical protein